MVAVAVALIGGCKPPRSPREVGWVNLTGEWISEASGAGGAGWRLSLRERTGGRLEGSGASLAADSQERFAVDGVRGEVSVMLRFRGAGEPFHYRAGMVDANTMSGELQLPRDTFPAVFRR